MSRMIPPPMAVIIANVITPTMSGWTVRMAVSTPLRANANVPARCSIDGLYLRTRRQSAGTAARVRLSRTTRLGSWPIARGSENCWSSSGPRGGSSAASASRAGG